jgi:hypothetical protein
VQSRRLRKTTQMSSGWATIYQRAECRYAVRSLPGYQASGALCRQKDHNPNTSPAGLAC